MTTMKTMNLEQQPTVRLVRDGLSGDADLHVNADAYTWLAVLNGERSIASALLLRRIRVRGPLRLLPQFRRCFPA